MDQVNGGGPPANGRTGRAGLLADLGRELRALRSDLMAAMSLGRQTAGEVAELLPRIDALESRPGPSLEREESPSSASSGLTPAIGWADLDAELLRAAWEALARWVGDVLCDGLALSRAELPDCWPLHRRAVLELAWLRTMYYTAVEPQASPALTAEWHSRWLPAALHNLTNAIDRRECGPGFHRLTREERNDYLRALTRARQEGRPDPELSARQDVDRPRVALEHVPERRAGGSPTGELTLGVDDSTPAGASRPEHWLDYYREASAGEGASRAAPERRPRGGGSVPSQRPE